MEEKDQINIFLKDHCSLNASALEEAAEKLSESGFTLESILELDEWTEQDLIDIGLNTWVSPKRKALLRTLNVLRFKTIPDGITLVKENTPITFNVTVAGGTPPYRYDWFCVRGKLRNKLNNGDDSQNSISINNAGLKDSGMYKVEVKDSNNKSLVSAGWTLSVSSTRNESEMTANERWINLLTSMSLNNPLLIPHFYFDEQNTFVLPDIGLTILFPMENESKKGYIYVKESPPNGIKDPAVCHIFQLSELNKLKNMIHIKMAFIRGVWDDFDHSLSKEVLAVICKLKGIDVPKDSKRKDYLDELRKNFEKGCENMIITDKLKQFGSLGEASIPREDLGSNPLYIGMPHKVEVPGGNNLNFSPLPENKALPQAHFAARVDTAIINTAVVDASPKAPISPPPSIHDIALGNVLLSGGICFGVELVRCIYQNQLTPKQAFYQIGTATLIGGALAAALTYILYAANNLSGLSNWVGTGARIIAFNPNCFSGLFAIAVSTIIDAILWYKGKISGYQFVENRVANVAAVAVGTLASGGVAVLLGASIAASWTGIGLIITAGIVSSMGAAWLARLLCRKVREHELRKDMKENSLALLGMLNKPSYTLEEVNARFMLISEYIHPDRVQSEKGDAKEFFNLLDNAKEFLISQSVYAHPHLACISWEIVE